MTIRRFERQTEFFCKQERTRILSRATSLANLVTMASSVYSEVVNIPNKQVVDGITENIDLKEINKQVDFYCIELQLLDEISVGTYIQLRDLYSIIHLSNELSVCQKAFYRFQELANHLMCHLLKYRL